MTFSVDNSLELQAEGIDIEKLFEMTATESLDHTGCPYECEIDLTITDDEGIRALNKEFRQTDKTTDVLSFPLLEFERPGDFDGAEEGFADCFNPESGELMLGSIVINIKRAGEQAVQYGHSLKREIAFLMVHSMLHLQGFDHIEDKDRILMEKAQDDILDKLGIVREASFEE